jgi:S-adenosyl-L-methionine hydrolase (adenosine-forming)
VVERADRGAVFLLTDYGYGDEVAGVTRAVVRRHAPGAPVVDLTHGVPPCDVRAGAFSLLRSIAHVGPGVVMAVVDPGVASGRRAVAVSVASTATPAPGWSPGRNPGPDGPGPSYLVGPDNGLLGWTIDALGGATAAVALPAVPGGPGSFDGRDLFAPVAARLWLGAGLAEVGSPIDPGGLVRLPAPRLAVVATDSAHPGSVETEVVWVDRFGNAQLAARPSDADRAGLGTELEVGVGSATVPLRRVVAFAGVTGAEIGLMVDANGHLAMVCDRRSAATVLGVRAGDVVTLRQAPRSPQASATAPPPART